MDSSLVRVWKLFESDGSLLGHAMLEVEADLFDGFGDFFLDFGLFVLSFRAAWHVGTS